MYELLALLALFVLVYSAIAGGVERTWISGPIVFTAFGLAIGPLGLGVIGDTEPEALKTLAEMALALVLFTDAAGANLRVLQRSRKLPIRLLAIGLPLTILAGFGVGTWLFEDLSVIEIALLATMLAPTDAALGKGVVANEAVPDPLREGLNVESGLNDGICVPIVLLFLALMGEIGDGQSAVGLGARFFGEAVGIGIACGVVLSLASVFLLRLCRTRGWISPTWSKVTVVGIAFACFGTAQMLGGSGFIASFTGGLLFGHLLHPHHDHFLDATEGIGDTFALLTWVLFGSAVVGQALGNFSWPILLYAVLSLTVVRMIPVFLCLTGLGMSRESRLFAGWFGPRGLASIVFAVIATSAGVPHSGTVNMVVVCTVTLSIVAHGLTANPWSKAFGARESQRG